MTASAKSATTAELRALLRRKFPAGQYAMLDEVRDAAGFDASRSMDVIVVGLWPSRGLDVQGMELKASRGDWLRELKRPEKAEAFVGYCDYWWVVSGDAGMVRVDELPPAWGLMTPYGRGLKVIRPAPKLAQPKPMDRSLLAALLKRATSTRLTNAEIEAEIETRVRAAVESRARLESREDRDDSYEHKRLARSVQEFEATSGIKIDRWNGGEIGAAVKVALDGEASLRRLRRDYDALAGRARELVRRLDGDGAPPVGS